MVTWNWVRSGSILPVIQSLLPLLSLPGLPTGSSLAPERRGPDMRPVLLRVDRQSRWLPRKPAVMERW
jgi:hypothetical protein